MTRRLWMLLGLAAPALALDACATQSSRVAYDQSYLAASHNWAFRRRFPAADRLLNAFDYGHAALYETLLRDPSATAQVEDREFTFITTRLLHNPPAVPLDETAIGPDFARFAPEVLAMFDWAHMLHRQLYDVWSTPGWTDERRDRAAADVIAYYRSRHAIAFSAHPKSMSLMEGRPYSLVFRQRDPKFNGLLWSYHWYQLALYDALITGRSGVAQQARIDSVTQQFFSMLDDAPHRMPAEMPMAPAAAPSFTARYPEAAAIFDNLHALHDVVSDILVSASVPPERKREAILTAAASYRDDTTAVISVDEWRDMARMMSPTPPPSAGRRER